MLTFNGMRKVRLEMRFGGGGLMLTVKTRSKMINVESRVILAVVSREDVVKQHPQSVFVGINGSLIN